MTNIGALDDALTSKCQDVRDEWRLCTKSQMEQTDALAFDLFNNQGFNLPTNIPDGQLSIRQITRSLIGFAAL